MEEYHEATKERDRIKLRGACEKGWLRLLHHNRGYPDLQEAEVDKKVGEKAEKWSENFFFTQFSEGFSLQPHSWYNGFFWLCLNRFSPDALSANASRQQASFDARSVTTVGHLTRFLGPSAPYPVSLRYQRVFAASKQLTRWGTICYSSQNYAQPFCSKTRLCFMSCCGSLTCKCCVECVYKLFHQPKDTVKLFQNV